MKIKNSVVFITGAAKGIGLSLSEQFLAKGAKVCMLSRSGIPATLREQYPDTLLDIQGSVSDPIVIQQCITQIKEQFGALDIVIANAGIAHFETLWNTSNEHAIDMIQTNLLGVFYTVKQSFALMKDHSGPRCIVGIHSIAATKVFQGSSVYAATKAGSLMMLRAFREEAREFGISVIDVLPGATSTTLWESSMLDEHKHKMMTAQSVASVIINALEFSRTDEQDVLNIDEITLRPWIGDL